MKKALLINPPVYDTQYWGHWRLPHGLLKIATYLKNNDYSTHLIDCLAGDKRDFVKKQKLKIVKFCSTVEYPFENRRLQDDERIKYCFGMNMDELRSELVKLTQMDLFNASQGFLPDEIYITSIMTYWWESTVDVVRVALEVFPEAKIRIGGIYPTLAPEHLRNKLEGICTVKVVPGSDFNVQDPKWQNEHLIVTHELSEASDLDLDFSLYDDKERPTYSILTTSRGCPHNCAYCAGHILSGNTVRKRSAQLVIDEIKDKVERYGIREFCFYEDNLLMGMDNFEQILRGIKEENLNLELHAPEGVEVNLVLKNPKILKLMKDIGFSKIYLPLETISQSTNERWNRSFSKIKNFEKVLEECKKANFSFRHQGVNAFVLFGLPGENINDVVDTVLYVAHKVGSVIPMLFTPVPGTPLFEEFKSYIEAMEFDFQHLNGKLLPFLEWNRRNTNASLSPQDYIRLERFMFSINSKVKGSSFDPGGEDKVSETFRHVYANYESVL